MILTAVLLFASWFHHKKPEPTPAPPQHVQTLAEKTHEAAINHGKSMVAGIAEKIPLWLEDGKSRFEMVEIATVEADIMMASQASTDEDFLQWTGKLQIDWDMLCVLDNNLDDIYI
jgi:hypothetical protein